MFHSIIIIQTQRHIGIFTLPNMPSYARLFRSPVRTFTLPEVNCLLELEPQFTLPDPTNIGGLLGFILMLMRWLRSSRGASRGAWVEVLLCCLHIDNVAIST